MNTDNTVNLLHCLDQTNSYMHNVQGLNYKGMSYFYRSWHIVRNKNKKNKQWIFAVSTFSFIQSQTVNARPLLHVVFFLFYVKLVRTESKTVRSVLLSNSSVTSDTLKKNTESLSSCSEQTAFMTAWISPELTFTKIISHFNHEVQLTNNTSFVFSS